MKKPLGETGETRRAFLAHTLQNACLLASTPLIASILSGCGEDDFVLAPIGDTEVQVDTSESRFQSLATVGNFLSLDSGAVPGLSGNGVFVIRDSPTSVVVLDRTCTHQGCQVGDLASNGVATCPCHGSQYNQSGSVIRGPAPRALRRYTATLNGNVIEFTV